MDRGKLAALALCFALLSACGTAQPPEHSAPDPEWEQEVYSSGYTAGYQEGYRQGEASRPLPEEGGSSEPEELPPELDPSGFVELSQAVPDAILELRYYSTYNVVGERFEGYDAPLALLTQ